MSAGADPLAGIGAPVGTPPPPSSVSPDPLAGIGAPVGAAPTPATTPVPASATQPTTILGKIKGYVDQAKAQNAAAMDQHPVLKAIDSIVSAPENANVGAVRGMALTAGGLAHIARKVTGTTGSTSEAENDVQGFGEGGDTYAEEAGKWIESAGEFMLGDAALKGLSYVDKLKHITPILKLAEKSPIVAKALDAAIQQGLIGGAQGYMKSGGNAKTAAEDAAMAGGTGALLEGGTGLVKKMIERSRPAVENIAGEGVQTLSSQRAGTGPRGSVKVNEVPEVAAAQQAAAPRVFRNLAQRATHDALEEANQGRRIAGRITEPARMLPAPEDARPYSFTIEGPGTKSEDLAGGNEPRKKQIGTEYVAGKGSGTAAKTEPYNEGAFKYGDEEPLPPVSDSEPFTGPTHKEPVFQYLTSLKPGEEIGSTRVSGGGDLVAADPETAQAHLSRLNDLVERPPEDASPAQIDALTKARNGLQEQMDLYHSYQRTLPNFAPIDSARAAEGVGHFGDAADQLQNAAKPIYQKFDEVTDGQFSDLNRQRVAAGKRGDFTAKHDYENQIDQLIDKTPGISQGDRLQATKLWNKAKVLDGLNDVINHSSNVSDKYASQVAGGRVLSGVRMQNGLKQLVKRYGQDRLESVIGNDGMENMTRIADLLNTPKTQEGLKGISMSVFHNIAHGKVGGALGAAIGHHVGSYEGMVAGAYAGATAERWMLQMAATSPRVGQLLDYAVRKGVTPKVAAGLISSAIMQENQSQHPEEKEAKTQ